MEIVKYDPANGGNGQRHALRLVNSDASPVEERRPFIEANTIQATLQEIQTNHVIPVFTKDNEPLISQAEFIEVTRFTVRDVFRSERINEPQIRVSHPIKGRVPEARNKPANELLDHERTLFYERMAFVIEIPSILDTVSGEDLCLVVGGVKAYNLDNLSYKKGADEHFKVFIGYRVKCCLNMCVWTDGLVRNLRVSNLTQLQQGIKMLLSNYDAISAIRRIDRLSEYSISESQFAQILGKCRMYQHLPNSLKGVIYDMQYGDSQLNAIARGYYKDENFCKEEDGSISLWKLYNLFTGANKSSYIDSFLERAANASIYVDELAYAIERNTYNWFIS
ncbi:MAG: DUF3871 family protein [Chitinophagaceae bacterium]|nr:MAG: DUF3871 family protein [Chitinophagaceae bacterium]